MQLHVEKYGRFVSLVTSMQLFIMSVCTNFILVRPVFANQPVGKAADLAIAKYRAGITNASANTSASEKCLQAQYHSQASLIELARADYANAIKDADQAKALYDFCGEHSEFAETVLNLTAYLAYKGNKNTQKSQKLLNRLSSIITDDPDLKMLIAYFKRSSSINNFQDVISLSFPLKKQDAWVMYLLAVDAYQNNKPKIADSLCKLVLTTPGELEDTRATILAARLLQSKLNSNAPQDVPDEESIACWRKSDVEMRWTGRKSMEKKVTDRMTQLSTALNDLLKKHGATLAIITKDGNSEQEKKVDLASNGEYSRLRKEITGLRDRFYNLDQQIKRTIFIAAADEMLVLNIRVWSDEPYYLKQKNSIDLTDPLINLLNTVVP